MSNQRTTTVRDDDLLLQDFSRNVTSKSSALFIGNAAIVSAIPLCKLLEGICSAEVEKWILGLFWRIHQMDLTFYFIHFIVGTAASAYFINLAYRNMKFILKHK